MSHRASTWLAELPPEIINNGAFRVLFHLCNAHNSRRAPHEACFPNQETLREVTGLSNGGLNNALNAIEKAGLMRRRRTRMTDGTRGATYYILGCDGKIAQGPTPESGDGTNSKSATKPSPNSGTNHLQWSGDKPVSEPVKEPLPPLYFPQADLFGAPEEKPPPRKRSVALPEGWVPSAKNIEDARKSNFTDGEIRNEAVQFRDHHHARATTFKCWDAAWRTWLRNARKFGGSAPRRSAGSRVHENLVSGFARALDQFDGRDRNLRSQRSHGKDVLQHRLDLRRVRSGSAQNAHQGRYGHRQSKGKDAGKEAKTN